jgi:2-methylcitrate dehydratase PrpD
MANALGIAGIHAAGLMEVMRGESMIKPLNSGRAANNGVLSALLAEQGITAPRTIFEGNDGFLRAYSDHYDAEKLMEGLGDEYPIMGTYVKLHAACRHAHPAIDCALKLAEKHDLTPDLVEEVVVRTYQTVYRLTGTEYEPKTVSTAKFSTPYCIAAALTFGRVSLDAFTPEKIADPKLLKLAQRVKVVVDPEIDILAPEKRGASLEITVEGGNKYEWAVGNPRGEPEYPVSDEELKDKFRSLVNPVLGSKYVKKIIKKIWELENLEDIRELTVLCGNTQ